MSQQAFPVRDPDRYGRGGRGGRPGRALRLVMVVVVAAAFVGYVLWVGISRARHDVRWELTAFDVTHQGRAEADLEVTGPSGRPLECDVAALDVDHGTVGFQTIAVPPGAGTRAVHLVVPTRGVAVAVDVRACRVRRSEQSGAPATGTLEGMPEDRT